MKFGFLVTFYEIKENNLGKLPRHFGDSFQMKCACGFFY